MYYCYHHSDTDFIGFPILRNIKIPTFLRADESFYLDR